MKRILIVDDEETSRKELAAGLRRGGFRVEEAADGRTALDTARTFRPAVVLADVGTLGGLALLSALQEEIPFCAVLLFTGQGTIEAAVHAMQAGAYDYLTKPVDVTRLGVLVEKALECSSMGREVALLRRRVEGGGRALLGRSKAMQDIVRQIELAAETAAPILIVGESGTGKELAALMLHRRSPRADAPYVAINCAAIPETLLESEIFGHEKGAFTGAVERRLGCFEMADGGTLLLDEVSEMPLAVQAKFLRVLEEGAFRRVGGKNELRVDVRVVAATNRDPSTAIRDGKLREDLYYRLAVFPIHLPPLREHPEDLPLLVDAFLHEVTVARRQPLPAVTPEALALLQEYRWPGNVRELRNVIERALILARGTAITPAHLAPVVLAPGAAAAAGPPLAVPLGTTVEAMEHALIVRTLDSTYQNKTRAAAILGVSLKTLHNKLNRYRSEEAGLSVGAREDVEAAA